jgi:hypothetical protein
VPETKINATAYIRNELFKPFGQTAKDLLEFKAANPSDYEELRAQAELELAAS